ncbi:MAG: hypothetical protein AABY22_32785 [Nanoarchaeota archaeon]
MYHIRLTLGRHELRLYPLKQDRLPLKDCDREGKPLTRKAGYLPAKYFYEDTEKEYKGDAFKLVNGEAKAKFKRTTKIPLYKYVDERNADDLITERYFYVDSPSLSDELEDNFKQAIPIIFTFGNGFMLYQGFIYYSDSYKSLICKMGLGSLSEKIKEVREETISTSQQEAIMNDLGVERVKEDEMLQLYGIKDNTSNSKERNIGYKKVR